MVLKRDLAIFVALIACGMLWIEHSHRMVIGPPTPAELTARVAAAACPDNDNVPYTAICLRFLAGSRWQPNVLLPAEATARSPK